MNEELQKQLAESINGFSSAVSGAKDFAIEQAPDVIHQYLMWGLAKGALVIVITIAIVYVSYLVTFKLVNQKTDSDGLWTVGKIVSSIVGGSASTFSFILCIGGVFDVAQILIAPKIYLIQQAASLIK